MLEPKNNLYPHDGLYPDDGGVAFVDYDFDAVSFNDDEEVLELIAHFIEAVDNA